MPWILASSGYQRPWYNIPADDLVMQGAVPSACMVVRSLCSKVWYTVILHVAINSLAPGKCSCNPRYAIFKLISMITLTARRCLKSPQSLYITSTRPTMVTHRSQSWSWMIDSQPFLSMSISASTPIPQIRLFQTLTFKLQGQGHGHGQRARPYSQPSI